jgi:hypothetical protein
VRIVAAAVSALALAACGGSGGGDSVDPTQLVARDIERLVERIDAVHPDPWHAISEPDFREAAEELAGRAGRLGFDELLVELMRLTALLGERDGHSGVFPLDLHPRRLHLLPIRLYEFTDGFFVVDSIGHPELVGARLTSIGGTPVEEVARAVRPLVPADNEWSAKARIAQYLVVAEVLDGLGFADHELRFDQDAVKLEAVSADAYAAAFDDLFHPMVPQGLPHRPEPPYLARRLEDRWSARVAGALYAAYNVTLGDPGDLARAVRRTKGPIIIDLRHNPGGDNGTYPPMLEALQGRDVVALIGRTTFSAAGNFITELELGGDVVFVGEPSGAAPNQYGDPVAVDVPSAAVTVQVASVYWQKSTPDDERLAIEPNVPVELSSRDFFAGRDPVLRTALRRALR